MESEMHVKHGLLKEQMNLARLRAAQASEAAGRAKGMRSSIRLRISRFLDLKN